MHFDVPKFVRSPGCDHGHDEESRNGRDIKIDILDDYVRTPEWFRGVSDTYRSTGGLPEPPGSQWALMGHSGKEEEAAKVGRAPPLPPVRIGLGKGATPLFPSPSFLLLSYSYYMEGGNPTAGGGRTPLGCAIERAGPSPPPLLYIRG